MKSLQKHIMPALAFVLSVSLGVMILLMFVATTGCGERQEKVKKAVEVSRQALQEQIDRAGRNMHPAPPAPTDVREVDVPRWGWAPTYFYTGAHNIRHDQTNDLDAAARFLKQNRNTVVEFGGHADMRGSERTNALLSRKRAEAVRDYLIRNGVNPRQAVTTHHGESDPASRDGTKRGWAMNRRTEAEIIR